MGKKSRVPKTITKKQQLILERKFAGPLPMPADLEQYNRILPGAAERILSMAEKQAEHRQGIENRVIGSDTRNSMLGLIFGFLIGALGLGCGFFLIFNGMLVEGSIFGGATLASLVTTFIYGSQQRRRERELKQ